MWLKDHSLQVLLPIFIVVGISAMVYEVKVQRHEDDGQVAVAHRPAEHPEIFKVNFAEGLDPKTRPDELLIAPPKMDPETWPCSQCHDKGGAKDNPKKRDLEEHQQIKLKHGDRWCLDCHDFKDRDKLHLANGELISFEESYKLCGQCHGPTYQDWKRGIHGKRTGYWNGPKRALLCVNCHWPHEPHFKSLRPMPPPVRPEHLRDAHLVDLQATPAPTPTAKPGDAPTPVAATSATPSASASPSATPAATATPSKEAQ